MESIHKSAIELIDEPTVEIINKPALKTIGKQVVETTDKLAEPTSEPVMESIHKSAIELTDEPAVAIINNPAVKSIGKRVVEAIFKPVAEAIGKPIVEAIVKPVLATINDLFAGESDTVSDDVIRADQQHQPSSFIVQHESEPILTSQRSPSVTPTAKKNDFYHYPIACNVSSQKFPPSELKRHCHQAHPKRVVEASNSRRMLFVPSLSGESSSTRLGSSTSTYSLSQNLQMCYICRKHYSTHTIKIHEAKYLKKWRFHNDELPVDMRGPEPVKSGFVDGYRDDLETASDEMISSDKHVQTCTGRPEQPLTSQQSPSVTSTAKKNGYYHYPIACNVCSQKFPPGELKRHYHEAHPQRVVEAANSRRMLLVKPLSIESWSSESLSNGLESSTSVRKAPQNMRMCYVCRNLYGRHSIKFHEPRCLEMWKVWNDKLPVNMRTPEPIKTGSKT